MKRKETKQFFYETLYDDVCDDNIKELVIDDKYKYYSKNIFYCAMTAVYYRAIIYPIAFIHCKIKKHIKYIGKEKLKLANGKGYFIFGNHTNNISDAFSPSMICKRKPYIIVNPKNLNVPILKKSTKLLGAIPLPTGLSATKNFMNAIEYRLSQKSGILIYPEAKIWPCYTKIRPYKSTSFKYPVIYDVPSFCFTTTYQKTKKGKCQIVIYVDGPFYADKTKNTKEQQEELHDKIFAVMTERSKMSNYETYQYIQKEKTL